MRRPDLKNLPIFACAGLVGFLFLSVLWNAAVERNWPKLRLRSAQALSGVSAPKPAPFTWADFLSGQTQLAVSTNLGRSMFPFPESVRAKNQLLFSLFRASGAQNIVIGREDQLYERNYVDAFCALGAADQVGIDIWAKHVKAIEDSIEARGASFVYLISPSKAARLSEYLPTSLVCPARERPDLDKLAIYRAALDAWGVAYVDGARLMSEKKQDFGIDLFPRGGTHWNLLGAAVTAREAIRKMDVESKGAPTGQFEFDWSQAEEAKGADRDLMDLLNLMWPQVRYPTAIVTGREKRACARTPKIVSMGSSFLREINIVLAQAPCPPEIEYWFYMMAEHGGYEVLRFRSKAGDTSNGEQLSITGREALREALSEADAVILEENETNIAATRQVGDAMEALSERVERYAAPARSTQ